MLLAIDVGNTDLKCGVWQDHSWSVIWRRPTAEIGSATALAEWIRSGLSQAGLSTEIDHVACASVRPALNSLIDEASSQFCKEEAFFLSAATANINVLYEPVTGLGADRIANAVGALAQWPAPVIVVDFGSATTLDVATAEGFLGGAILPGLRLQMDSLTQRTAQLPAVPLELPPNPIGNSTVYGLQSGIVLGHLAAVEGLLVRMQMQLNMPATVVATGGYSYLFMGATAAIHHFVSTLTLDGIREASLQT